MQVRFYLLIIAVLSFALVASAQIWGNSRRDPSHTGFASTVPFASIPASNWTTVIGNEIAEGIVVDNLGNIYGSDYLSGYVNRIVSFSPAGTPRWEGTVQLASPLNSLLFSPQVGVIAIGAAAYPGYTGIWTVSPNTGRATPGGLLPGQLSGNAILSPTENALFVPINGTLYKTNLDGSVIYWNQTLQSKTVNTFKALGVTADGSKLVASVSCGTFCLEESRISGLDTATGKVLWKIEGHKKLRGDEYTPKNAVYNPVNNVWVLDNWDVNLLGVNANTGSIVFTAAAQGNTKESPILGAVDPVTGQIYVGLGHQYASFNANGTWLWTAGGSSSFVQYGRRPNISIRSPYQGNTVAFAVGAEEDGLLWGFYPNGSVACEIPVQTVPLENVLETILIGNNVYVLYVDSTYRSSLACFSLTNF